MYTVLHVAAGDDLGKIWVYDVGEQLAVPQADEWNKFAHTLQVREGGGGRGFTCRAGECWL